MSARPERDLADRTLQRKNAMIFVNINIKLVKAINEEVSVSQVSHISLVLIFMFSNLNL